MTVNGTEAVARAQVEVKADKRPVLDLNGTQYECRDLSSLTWAEQIKANKLMDRLSELQENLQEYFDIDDDEDDDEEDPPEEIQEQWRKVHQRIVRFGFPGVKGEDVRKMSPSDVALASGRFTSYMQEYGSAMEQGAEGNGADAGTQNRKSRRTSRKRARSSATSTE